MFFCFVINIRHIYYIIIKKKVDSARLRESDIHPIQSEDPSPTILTYRQKEEKWKKSRRL